MSALLFVVGYILAAVLGVHVLSSTDPEPLGASAGLSLFAAAGFIVALFVYTFSITSFSRAPRPLASFCAGALCAACLFAFLALTGYLDMGHGISIGIAATALVAVAALAPLCSAEA